MPAHSSSMDLSNKHLFEIPDDIFDHKNLNWLILSNNSIRIINHKILQLKELTRLALNDNKINTIDRNIGKLKFLAWIDLTRNRLSSLPKEISNLKNLSGLGLSENNFEEIPECVYSLHALKKFGFFANKLRTISPSISNLINLTKIDLSNNKITSLPDEICLLRNLTWLNLSSNRLKQLPKNINQLKALEELGLGCNQLEELPSLAGLKKLRILPVFKNKIKEIKGLETLENLEKLDLSDNELIKFPNEVIKLKNLKYLNFKNNNITEIDFDTVYPPVISSITMIDVSNNLLTHLPLKFFKTFSNLTTIRIVNNPFEYKEPVVPSKIPDLLSLCYMKMINMPNQVQDYLWEKGELLFRNAYYVCDSCSQIFVVEPYMGYNLSSIGDGSTFIVRKTLCSYLCYKKEFNDTGANLSEERLLNR
ncbi:Toll-like receptor 1 [Gurleya vavrai]